MRVLRLSRGDILIAAAIHFVGKNIAGKDFSGREMASQVYWRNGVVGDWFVGGNWVSGVAPTTGDTATIEVGTAILDQPVNPLIGIAIVLGEGDAVLRAIDATFEGTDPPQGTPEINATLTVTGSLAASTDAVFNIQGEASFDGQIFVEAIAGGLTILIQDDSHNHAGVFRLLNTDEKAAIVVSQESYLDFEGQTVFNEAFIQIEGTGRDFRRRHVHRHYSEPKRRHWRRISA